jgi:hypothetical protein
MKKMMGVDDDATPEQLLRIATEKEMNSQQLMNWVHQNIPFRQLQVLCRDLQQRARSLPFHTVIRGVKTLRATCQYLAFENSDRDIGPQPMVWIYQDRWCRWL